MTWKWSICMASLLLFAACEETYTPKPRAYPRMELPAPTYYLPDSATWNCPYIFELSDQSVVTVDPRYKDSLCWYNIYYPKLRATIHLTYTPVENNLAKQIEDNRKLAMKHIGMAVAIEEVLIERDSANVYGIVYDFRGGTATDIQFFMTDSTHHFLRGALYFNVNPNKDSLAPAIRYVEEDIRHIIRSLAWTR